MSQATATVEETNDAVAHREGLNDAELIFLDLVVHSGLDMTEAWRRANRKKTRTKNDRAKAFDWRNRRPHLLNAMETERAIAVKRNGITRDRLIQAYQAEAFTTSAHILDPYTGQLHPGLEPADFAAVEQIRYSEPGVVQSIKLRNPDKARQKLEDHLAEEQGTFKKSEVPELAFSFLPPGGDPNEHYVLATDNTITIVMSDAQRRWLFALRDCDELLVGGAAGGGKSDWLRIVAFIAGMLCKKVTILLLRRTRTELEDNHMNSVRGFHNFLAPLEKRGLVTINETKLMIRFKHTGSILRLAHFQHEKDYRNFHGGEYHIVLYDELTTFSERMYRRLRGRQRSQGVDTTALERLLPGIRFPLSISGSNPGMSGHAWVKRTFITGMLPHKTYEMPEDEGGMRRRYEPALYTDNPWLDPSYIGKLKGLGNPSYVKALLEGDWDIVAGGMWSELWHPDTHIIKPFSVPSSWTIRRGYDHGTSDPFAVLWMAESDGCEVTLANGSKHTWPRGTRFFVSEIYGANEKGQGLQWTTQKIAEAILEKEKQILKYHNVPQITNGPADTSIWNGEKQGKDVAKEFSNEGLVWDRAVKGPGSRSIGWQLVGNDLQRSLQGAAGIYFFENLVESGGLIGELREAPRDEDNPKDLPAKYPDHALDTVRYLLTHRQKKATVKKQRRHYG